MRGTLRMLLPALALAVALMAVPGSAFAAVATLERSGGATAFTSANKSSNAPCPAGKRVVGTGADIGDGAGQVGIADMIPNATLTGASVRAVEDGNGFSQAWSLGGSALCSTPVPGLERLAATSATSSANKGVTATCPTGKRLLGTGAAITGGSRQVVLRELIPNSGLTSVSAFGAEDENGFTGNWSITAYAVCSNPVRGLQRVATPTGIDSNDGKLAIANCPIGKRVTGVGGALNGATGQVVMDDLIPFPNPALSVQVQGIEDENGTTANWSATAYAICVNSVDRVVASSADSPDNPKTATAFCLPGEYVTNAGGDISGGVGEVFLDDLAPLVDVDAHGTTASGYADQSGTDRNWFVRAYAVCSTPLPGFEVVNGVSALDSTDVKNVVVACPAGKRVVGAGGMITGGEGRIVLDAIAPNAALTSVTASAQEDLHGFDEDWRLFPFAVCANAPAGLQLISASSDRDSEEIKSVKAVCPAGKTLLGSGGEIANGSALVALDDLTPGRLLTDVTVTGVEGEIGHPGSWSVGAYAICANV